MTARKFNNLPDPRYKKRIPEDGEERVMLSVRKSTKHRLEKIGTMTDTFDSLINKLIDDYKKKN